MIKKELIPKECSPKYPFSLFLNEDTSSFVFNVYNNGAFIDKLKFENITDKYCKKGFELYSENTLAHYKWNSLYNTWRLQ